MEITWRAWRVISREGEGGEWGKRYKHIGRHKIDGEVKNSIGNGEAEELTYMTLGHELR